MAPQTLLTIPVEMVEAIFGQASDPDSIIKLALTCRRMHSIASTNILPAHRAAAQYYRNLDLRPGALGANGAVLQRKGTTGSLLAGYLEHFLLNEREGGFVKSLTLGGFKAGWDVVGGGVAGTTAAAATTTPVPAPAAATTVPTAATAAATPPLPAHTRYSEDTFALFLSAHDRHAARLLYEGNTRSGLEAFWKGTLKSGSEDAVAALLLCVLPELERVRVVVTRDENGAEMGCFGLGARCEG